MPGADVNFDAIVKQMLLNELERPNDHKFLPDGDIEELLDSTEDITDDYVRKGIFGYPTRPLYRDLSQKFNEWMNSKCCPMELLPNYHLLDERQYEEKRKEMADSLKLKVFGFEFLFDHWSKDERHYHVREIFRVLGKRGLLDMLGVRKTVGSKDIWPPPRRKLEEAFFEKCKWVKKKGGGTDNDGVGFGLKGRLKGCGTKCISGVSGSLPRYLSFVLSSTPCTIFCSPESSSQLTVGARALSKHAHRDSGSSWWGVCTGTESYKNEHAQQLLKLILDNATWLNIHGLPNDISTVEARQENG